MNTVRRLSASQRQVQQAWHAFLANGRGALAGKNHQFPVSSTPRNTPPNIPRDIIWQAWQSAFAHGIDPGCTRAPTAYAEEQIEQLLGTDKLGIVGRKVLERMAALIEDTGHVMVLADDKGRIVHSVGHGRIQDALERINFRPGGDWREEVVGPNGIGTPLALGRAESVSGSEHYCVGWKPWNCYGAPVHHPADRALLGCVDITGPAHAFQSQGMALVASIAQTIEAELLLLHLRQREKLRQYFQRIRQQHPKDSLLLVDSGGQLLDHTSDIPALLDRRCLASQAGQGGQYKGLFKQAFPALWAIMQSVMDEGEGRNAELATRHYPYLAKCALTPAPCDEGYRAVLVIIARAAIGHAPARPEAPPAVLASPLPAEMSGDMQAIKDDVIRQALASNGGNVSRAAKALRINRSTIYRRMKRLSRTAAQSSSNTPLLE